MIERLAKLADLWAVVHFFHPFLTRGEIDWDAAVAEAAARVVQPCDPTSFAGVIREMLDSLGDPVTRVLDAADGQPRPRSDPAPIVSHPSEGVLCLTLNRSTVGGDFTKECRELGANLPELANADGVILDLRSGGPVAWLPVLIHHSGIAAALVPKPVATPGERRRMHNGLKGDRSKAYSSGFQVIDGSLVTPSGQGCRGAIVFLVDAGTVIPPILLGLQVAGIAHVVAEGAVTDESVVDTWTITMTDGIRVQVRTSELVHADGTTGFVPDVAVSRCTTAPMTDETMRAALDIIRNPRAPRAERKILPPMTIPPPASAQAVTPFPSLGYRLVAAFGIWSTIRFFFPYRDLMDEDWDQVLRAYLPVFIDAENALAYHLGVAEMYSQVRDSHGRVRSQILEEHFGAVPSALYVRWIEGQPVVAGFRDQEAARAAGVEIGDVILSVDGESATDRIERYARYVAVSTLQSRMARVTESMMYGADGSTAAVTIQGRDGARRAVAIPRMGAYPERFRYRSGPVVQILEGNIGYIDLDRLARVDVEDALDLVMDTRAIIFDMRGYPEHTGGAIAARIVVHPEAPAALFHRSLLLGPGERGHQRYTFTQKLPPRDEGRPGYPGRTVMLIDERAASESEHTGLWLHAANGTTFVGSPTAGSDGDVTGFTVPGGISLVFTGQGVRHADGRQLQRVGLTPHLAVVPTIAGIRDGRDEVLEAAVAFLSEG